MSGSSKGQKLVVSLSREQIAVIHQGLDLVQSLYEGTRKPSESFSALNRIRFALNTGTRLVDNDFKTFGVALDDEKTLSEKLSCDVRHLKELKKKLNTLSMRVNL